MDSWKIDDVLVVLISSNKKPGEGNKTLHIKEEVSAEKIQEVYQLLCDKKVARLELGDTSSLVSMTVFAQDEQYQIGIVDEGNDLVYYFNSGNGDNKNVNISGHTFKEWMVCHQESVMLEIVKKFVETGECLDTAAWVKEET